MTSQKMETFRLKIITHFTKSVALVAGLGWRRRKNGNGNRRLKPFVTSASRISFGRIFGLFRTMAMSAHSV